MELSPSALEGVWSLTSANVSGDEAMEPAQPGLYIFTEGHYSAIYSLGAEPRPRSTKPFEPTSDEKVAQYDTLIVNTGTYEASDGTITLRPVVAKSPELLGGHSTLTYQIDDDVLTLQMKEVVAADGTPAPLTVSTRMRLRRLE